VAGGYTRFFGGRTIMRATVSRENGAAGAVLEDGGAVPAVPGNVAGGGDAGGVPAAVRVPLRELVDDRLLDALLERSRDQAGGCG
jgi:hypothetical protein